MKNEKFEIHLGEGVDVADITIREVNTVNELPVKSPVQINLNGTIESVLRFLEKRHDQEQQINQKLCHIIVDREKMTMTLITNENDFYGTGKVVGQLKEHPKFIEFGINSEKSWDPNKLGQFIKMNRAYFPDKEINMQLVTDLKNFEANINSKVERQRSETGSFKDNFAGVVSSNLPASFKLNIPLFRGSKAEEIDVEFYANVDGRNISLQLFSPGAAEAMEKVRDAVIDEQIEAIRALTPEIVIIEQ